jgi:uncharacterized membrane protein
MGEPKRTRLVFLGFGEEREAEYVLEFMQDAIAGKEIVVEDWALVRKEPGGQVTVRSNKKADPGAARGGAFGGAAGAVLAILSGPIGVGAVVAGTAVGAVTAAARDSGLKDDEINEVSKLMADGRTGLMIAVPLSEAERFDQFMTRVAYLPSHPDRTYQVDIVPGRTFERALNEYRLHEEDPRPDA